jgi:septal ring factor EnvC (AmiA/AmiB activator)
MEKLNNLSKEELICLLMLKTDTITQYDVLCAKHSVLFERYRELCKTHINYLKSKREMYRKEDWDSFKKLYHQTNQIKSEIQRVCKELKELERVMEQISGESGD